jgi:membrane-bound lytic murein transglycosylase A
VRGSGNAVSGGSEGERLIGRMRIVGVAGLLALAAACGPIIPPPTPVGPPVMPGPVAPVTPPAPPPTALTTGVRAGPDVLTLGLTPASATPALLSFRESCPRLTARTDNSGLTQPGDWKPACDTAATWPNSDAARFFTENFETAVVGEGQAFVTGYYEPEIAGSRYHQAGFDVPVYGVPPDLVHARPGDAPVKPNGQTPFGRYDETGHFVPYYERAEIVGGRLAGRNLEIGWAADPIEFFFLQVQGSGRLRAPDGSVMRIGYAADNGQNYTSIGILMRDRGLIGTGPGQYAASMQGLMQYLREHPDDGRALMNQNKAWVFFRELTGDGPVGALGVPVRAHVSLATDPLFVPLGAPVFLNLDRPVASGLWVAQDTGGAIKGANRFDSFWGAGPDARVTAGGMSGRGPALLLLPKGALARLGR